MVNYEIQIDSVFFCKFFHCNFNAIWRIVAGELPLQSPVIFPGKYDQSDGFWSKVGNSDLQNKIPSGYLT